ncbi:MAG: hypothetical protein KDB50_09850 [Mycobacterium sp.]|nr:hypothetical protein [Mycobacterium sp.]
MNDVDRWFGRAASRRRSPVSLYTCFLTGRLLRYFRYRLRYPFLIAAVRFAVHVAEFFVVLASLGGLAAFIVMVLRAGSLLVAGGWWGLLEIMRDRLRTFAQLGRREASEDEVGRWLLLAGIIGGLVTIGGGAALLLIRPAGADAVSHVYAFLIILEVAIGLGVRVLHSGIYATRRVYKPVWSMFAPTVVQLMIIGLGFSLYPAAAIVIAIIASNALSIGLTVHFSLEAYRLTGMRPRWSVTDHGLRQHLPRIPLGLGLKTTMSGLSLRLDALLVLALIGFYGTDARTFDLTAVSPSWQNIDAFRFFYLILPLFRGSYESAGIFYFDFVRLRTNPALRELQWVFFRKLLRVSPVIALFFWALAAVLGTTVLHDVPIAFLLALLPMFVLRSVIGIYQIRLFAEGRFRTHLGTLVLLAVLLWLVWLNPNPAGDLVQITAAMIVQLIVLINVQHIRDRRLPPRPTLVSLREWLSILAREPGPVFASMVQIPRSITARQRSAAIGLLRRRLTGRGHLGFRSASTLVCFRRCDHDAPGKCDLADLQAETGFVVGHETRVGEGMDGRAALARLVAGKWIEPPEADEPEDLNAQFRALFPNGIIFRVATQDGATQMRTLDEAFLAQAMTAALMSLEDGADLVRVADRLFTPVFRRGTLRRILVLPPDPDPATVREWHRIFRVWSAEPALAVANG